MQGETMYGRFTALAESGLTLPDNQVLPTDVVTRISLAIFTSRGARVLTVRNVDTRRGATVPALVPGNYEALWKLSNANGDTRLLGTRFIEQAGRAGPGPGARVSCRPAGGGRVRCGVSFPGYAQVRGNVRMRLTRGSAVVALGHRALRRGRATLVMSELVRATSGSWRATLVLSGPHIEPVTIGTRVTGLR